MDEDDAQATTPSELARLEDAARQSEMARDRRNVEQGRRILADYLGPGVTYRQALRAYMTDLREGRRP